MEMLKSKNKPRSVIQESGDNSVNVSAKGDVNISTGLSVADVKEIFKDSLEQNLKLVQSEAIEEARRRSEVLVEEFLSKAMKEFKDEAEERFAQFRDPSAHISLRQAQQNYCRYGDDEVKDVSLDLLIQRISRDNSDYNKIKIDQAIEIVGKLTSSQISLLGLISLIGYGYINALNESDLNIFFETMLQCWRDSRIDVEELEYMETIGALVQHTNTQTWKSIPYIFANKKEFITDNEHAQNLMTDYHADLANLIEFWDAHIKPYNLTPVGKEIAHTILNSQYMKWYHDKSLVVECINIDETISVNFSLPDSSKIISDNYIDYSEVNTTNRSTEINSS